MTIEQQISALLAQAEQLRLLPDDEAESMGLPGIVDMINALRAEQASGMPGAPATPVVTERKKPGPKPKVKEDAPQ